jgi:hypothetical protein
MSRNANYRLALALAVGTVLFLVLGIGALGIIGEGGSDDRMYVAVLAVCLVGTVVARLQPHGMALTLAATAVAQVVVGLVAIARGLHTSPGASVIEIMGLTGMYAALFAASAWFFWRAAEQESPVLAGGRG